MTEIIASSQNRHLKLLRKLTRRRVREQEGAFAVEGEDLVLAGLETGARPRVLLVDVARVPDLDPSLVPCPVLQVEPNLLADASGMAHPPRIIGIFDLPEPRDLADTMDQRLASAAAGPWIALDALTDPGNVGTIIRTAAALGAGGVVTLPDTADPWGPKAVRASMGSCFRTPVVRLDEPGTNVADAFAAVRERMPALRVVALDASGDVPLWDVPLDATTVIVIGGEREGLREQTSAGADVIASIPQRVDVESINAGVAASIALYESRRRGPAQEASS